MDDIQKSGSVPVQPAKWSVANLHSSAGAWIILALSALITLAAWKVSSESVRNTAEVRFQYMTDDIQSAIRERMIEQEVALWGGVGLFSASEKVTREEWRSYVSSLRLGEFLPGLQGYGYSEFVQPKQRDAFVGGVRSEGFPDFDIRPAGERGLYSSIIYLEPFSDRNLRAFGYDMWSEPTRRKAMARARDTGATAVSGMVTLVQETDSDVQRGFLMYLPVYRKGMPTETVEERRAAIKGFVYSPFRIKDLMQGILGKGDKEIGFRIYDGRAVADDMVMYDSAGDYSAQAETKTSMFSNASVLESGGHPWTLSFRTQPGFISASDANEPLIVAGVGICIDILLFLTILSLSNQRSRAQKMANKMTGELREAKERAEHAANAEIVLRTSAQESNEKLKTANEGLMRFTSIIAHDLRAPLKRIEAFVGILREEYAEKFDEEGRGLLSRITRGSSRMRSMLDSMHHYSKCSTVSLDGKSVRLETIIDNAMDALSEDLRDAQVKTSLNTDCRVKGDHMLLEHVVQNLVANSVKFCGEDSPVIKIEAKPKAGGFVELSVTDNGIGIDDKHARSVFDMFTRLHNEDEYDGTGIGLAICKKIITDHGGDIAVDTRWKGGTRIVATLQDASVGHDLMEPAEAA